MAAPPPPAGAPPAGGRAPGAVRPAGVHRPRVLRGRLPRVRDSAGPPPLPPGRHPLPHHSSGRLPALLTPLAMQPGHGGGAGGGHQMHRLGGHVRPAWASLATAPRLLRNAWHLSQCWEVELRLGRAAADWRGCAERMISRTSTRCGVRLKRWG